MTALYALALVVFAVATPPLLWPGALAFVLAWTFLPRWRGHLAWSAIYFSVYLFFGADLKDAVEMKRLAFLAGKLTFGLLAFAYSSTLAENNSSWAPLPFLLWAFLIRPDGLILGLGLLAWAGWQLVRQQRQNRELGRSFAIEPRGGLLAAVIVLALAALLANAGTINLHQQTHVAAPASTTSNNGHTATAPPPGGGVGGATIPEERVSLPLAWEALAFKILNWSISLGLLVLLALVTALWWRLVTTPATRQRVDRKSLLLVLLSVISLALGITLFALAFPGKGIGLGYASQSVASPTGAQQISGQSQPATTNKTSWLGLFLLLAAFGVLVLVALMAYLLFQLLRHEPTVDPEETATPPPGRRSPAFAGRVRTAYREFLRLMLAHAPASRSETPREYARRLERRYPELADWVRELTDLYEPVRYGGLADEREAARAEELARLIAAELEKEREET